MSQEDLIARAGRGAGRAPSSRASDAVFGPWTIALLFGTGLFLTVRFRFVQVARFREACAAMRRAAHRRAAGR